MAALALVDGFGFNPLTQTNRYQGALHGKRVWYVSPVYQQAKDIWDTILQWIPWARVNKSDRIISFPGGGQIQFRTANQCQNLRGVGLDGLVIDEAAFIEPDVYLKNLRPTLTDRQGWCWIQSSPDGQGDNLLWKVEEAAAKLDDWSVYVFETQDNPLIPLEEIDTARQLLGDAIFSQEYQAKYIQPTDALFNGEWLTDEKMLVDELPSNYISTFMSIDPCLGVGSKSDYASVAFIGYVNGKFWVDIDVARRNPETLFQDAKVMWMKHGNPRIVFETSVFQHIMADVFFNKMGIPPEFAYRQDHQGQNKKKRILRLAPYLSRNEIKILRSPSALLTLTQMRSFPDPKVNDDAPDSIEQGILALHECQS